MSNNRTYGQSLNHECFLSVLIAKSPTAPPETKRQKIEDQQFGDRTYPPSLPVPPRDSAACAVSLSVDSETESDTEEFVCIAQVCPKTSSNNLQTDDDSDSDVEVLLAGGRRELNLKEGKSKGRAKLRKA